MRLPWFFGPRPTRRRPERGRHQSAPTLRVRQLERRRVLDAAGSTVVVDVALQSGQETTIATPVTNTDALEFNWVTPDATSESQAAVNSFGSSTDVSASGASTQPALIATVDQTVNEGSLLDLSGLGGASPLGLILDPDAGETHTAAVNWGDAPLTQFDPVTVFDDGGFAKPLGGTHTYADGPGVYTVTIRVADNTMSGDFVNGVNGVDFVEDTFTVTVNNVPPTLIISGNSTTDEGSTYTLNLSSSDPGDDTITSWEINWGDGTIENVLGNPSSVTHVYANGDANYTISATATDEDGTFTANTLDVFVQNVAPTITSVNLSDTTIPEGQSVTVSGTFTDPALGVPTETFTVVIDWGNGATSVATVDNALGTYTATYTYADDHPLTGTPDDTFTITVTVTDDDGGSSSTAGNDLLEREVTVTNVAPTITAIDLSTTVLDEGQSLTVSGTFTDPALGQATETFTVVVNWGNGDTSVAVVDAALGTYTATYLYRDDHPESGTDQDIFSITVEIVDDDGGSYHSSTDPDLDRCVTVRNVAPAVSLDAVTPVNENGVATLTGSYTDIGILDSHTVVVDWDDPNDTQPSTFSVPAIHDAAGMPTLAVGQTIASSTDGAVLTITAINAVTGQVSFSVQHQYLDDGLAPGNGISSDASFITVTVTDDDTGSSSQNTTVTVQNVAPTVAVNAVAPINENGTVTLTGSYTDIGLLDGHSLVIDWDDPNNSDLSSFEIPAIRDAAGNPTLAVGQTITSSTDSAVLTITAINAATGQVSFSVQHQYLDDGLAPGNNMASDTSTIVIQVTDDDGGSNSTSTAMVVNNVGPSISLGAVSGINENGVATLTGSYTDIGLLDGQTMTVNWGDPNNAQLSTFTIPAIRDAAGNPTLAVGQTITSSTDSAVLTITAINAATWQVSFSTQHQYLDDGLAPGNGTASDTNTITVNISDDDSGTSASATSVLVSNVAPTVSLNPVAGVSENGVATLTGSYTDIGLLDGQTMTVNWGDPNNSLLSTFTIPAIQDADGNSTLSVGQTIASSTDGAILTITAINAATGQVSFSTQHQYLDDGLAPGNNTASDTSTISVTVTDDDGGSNVATTTVLVQNVAPTVSVNTVSPINENGFATLTGSYTDIGLLDTHTLTINWDDPNDPQLSTFAVPAIRDAAGNPTLAVGQTISSSTDEAVLTITAINAATGQVSFSVQHQYLDDGIADGVNGANNTASDTSTITVTVADDDLATNTASTTVVVNNVAPSVSLNGVSAINENSIATLTGSFTDIGRLDRHTMTVNWDDPNDAQISSFTIPAIRDAAGNPTLAVGQTIASSTDEAVLTITAINATTGQVSFSVQHQYLDDGLAPGNNTASDTSMITVTVADDDTGSNAASTTVVVNNVNPVLTVSAPITINEGSLLDLLGSGGSPTVGNFTDVGTLDRHAAQIDWGDGYVEIGTVIQSAGGGLIIGSHTYADDGVYTVIVRLADDDMGAFASPDKFNAGITGVDYVQATFTVTVLNVAPSLTDGGPANVVDEGSSFVLSDLGSGQSHLGIGLSDPGFDNPLNPTTPALGNPFSELFVGYTIDWGDGTADTPVNVVMRNNGAPDSATTALFEHAAHTYADNGTYTVRVRVADDNMGAYHDASLFETGVEGVDFVDLTFTITVNNVAPTMTVPVVSADTINENGSVSFNVSFSDPGFDNPLNDNTPPNGGEVEESFTYDIDWGDNRQTLGNVAVAATPGGVGVPSQGSFGGSHVYADDGTYTVTVTIHDDDGGSFTRQFNVVVQNVAPQFIPQPDGSSFQGDDINTSGVTTIRVGYRDPGFDNPANPNSPVLPHISNTQHEVFAHVLNWGDGSIDALHTYANDGIYTVTITISGADLNGTFTFTDFVGSNTSLLTLVSGQTLNVPGASAYTYTVDWGDGTIQTISLTLNQPLVPLAVAPRTTVLVADRVSGDIGVHTTGGFEVQHKYTGPPNPLNPSADIAITVTVMDDNNGFVAGTIFVPNPGIETINVAIDTTPQVPRLEYLPPAPPQPLLNQSTATILGLQSNDVGGGGGDSAVTSERFLELVAYAPDGSEVGRYRLQEEALADLRGLFAKLPDGHYKIFLVRTDNNSRRLVMEVYVRRGRVIDPSDDSEGIRDRPPTSEAEERPQAVPAAKPGENREKPDAASLPRDEYAPMPSVVFDDDVLDLAMPTDSQPAAISYSALRWGTALAGVAVAAGARPWSSTVESAFAEADGRAWQRLRRAGRLGGSSRRGIKPTTTQDRPKN